MSRAMMTSSTLLSPSLMVVQETQTTSSRFGKAFDSAGQNFGTQGVRGHPTGKSSWTNEFYRNGAVGHD